jgi:hypothetical protein
MPMADRLPRVPPNIWPTVALIVGAVPWMALGVLVL